MEPPVIPNCKMESELVILQIIFTDIDMETVTGDIVERFIIYFDFLFVYLRRMYPELVSSSLISARSFSVRAMSSAVCTDSR